MAQKCRKYMQSHGKYQNSVKMSKFMVSMNSWFWWLCACVCTHMHTVLRLQASGQRSIRSIWCVGIRGVLEVLRSSVGNELEASSIDCWLFCVDILSTNAHRCQSLSRLWHCIDLFTSPLLLFPFSSYWLLFHDMLFVLPPSCGCGSRFILALLAHLHHYHMLQLPHYIFAIASQSILQ